jgi:16S rRNA (adenine1518-N6/adenine1519-N6)-dimethyltransferase
MKNSRNGSPESLLAHTRKMMRRFHLRARKGLGQHFLVDGEALEAVVNAADLQPTDTVIEVGPGLGIMTAELARRGGWVIAIELDDTLAGILMQTLPSDNVVVLNQDVLGTDPAELFVSGSPHVPAEMTSYKVVANLPYYITAPVLRHFLEAAVKPSVMVVMVQKEVAETITAAAGKRSLLSIAVQLYGEPELVRIVPKDSFFPAPAVNSAIIRIRVLAKPRVDVEADAFFRVVRAGFSAARKQIGNSLAQGLKLTKEASLELLAAADVDPCRRAETLELEEWAAVLRAALKNERD